MDSAATAPDKSPTSTGSPATPRAFTAAASGRRGIRLANLLTLSRIALAPVFVWAFLQGHVDGHARWAQWTALAVSVSFELTDAFDGWVARRRNEVSDLGKVLDPLADSISRFTVFLCFLVAGYASVWALCVIFWRDSVVSVLRIVCAGQDIVLAARTWGKAKAIVQAVAINAILVFGLVPSMPWWDSSWHIWQVEGARHYLEVADAIMWGVAAVTAVSLVDYLRGNRDVLRKIDI